MPTYEWNYRQGAGGGGGESTILDGIGEPPINLGVTGDYYVDTFGQVLFGPKQAEVDDPPLTTLFTNEEPLEEQIMESGLATFGNDIKFFRSGQITGLRYYRSWNTAPDIESTTFHIWDAGGTHVGTAITSDETYPGWKIATLAEPVNVTMNSTFRIGIDIIGEQGISIWFGPYGFGEYEYEFWFMYNLGNFLSNEYMAGVLAYGSPEGLGYPIMPAPFLLMIDAVFQPTPTNWPVAIAGGEGGGGGGGAYVPTSGGTINGNLVIDSPPMPFYGEELYVDAVSLIGNLAEIDYEYDYNLPWIFDDEITGSNNIIMVMPISQDPESYDYMPKMLVQNTEGIFDGYHLGNKLSIEFIDGAEDHVNYIEEHGMSNNIGQSIIIDMHYEPGGDGIEENSLEYFIGRGDYVFGSNLRGGSNITDGTESYAAQYESQFGLNEGGEIGSAVVNLNSVGISNEVDFTTYLISAQFVDMTPRSAGFFNQASVDAYGVRFETLSSEGISAYDEENKVAFLNQVSVSAGVGPPEQSVFAGGQIDLLLGITEFAISSSGDVNITAEGAIHLHDYNIPDKSIRIAGVDIPVDLTDAANKAYVDSRVPSDWSEGQTLKIVGGIPTWVNPV